MPCSKDAVQTHMHPGSGREESVSRWKIIKETLAKSSQWHNVDDLKVFINKYLFDLNKQSIFRTQ
jgi:hypothetical protein